MSTSISLLKYAVRTKQASNVGKAFHAGGKIISSVVRGAGNAGRGLAEGLGTSGAVGEGLGYATLATGATVGGAKAKRKVDEWRYQHNFGGY